MKKTSLGTCVVGITALAAPACVPKDGGAGSSPAGASELKACPPTAMIEDGEDNNNQVIVRDDRSGYIYTYVDKVGTIISPNSDTGEFTLAQGGANGSKFAIRFQGKVGTADTVFAGVGLNFVDPKAAYDASRFKGLSFYAKAGPGTSKVRLKVPDVNTDPDGKVCTDCYNDFGTELTLTNEWQKYTVPFSAMAQDPGWGSPNPSAITPEKIYSVQFQVNDKGSDYDIWLDDVSFVGCQ